MIFKNNRRSKGIMLRLTLLFLILFAGTIMSVYAENRDDKGETMNEDQRFTTQEFHQKFAIDLNNYVWSILSKEERTEREEELMIHAAHASRLHWGFVGTALNLQRGEWLISRVYSVLNRPKAALIHAEKCLKLAQENDFDGFDLAYSYEAMARANAASGNKIETEKYYNLATEAGNKIEKEEDRKLFFDDLKSEPWYGMK